VVIPLCLILVISGPPAGAGPVPTPVPIDNDLPTSTLGHWSVTAFDGGEANLARTTVLRLESGDVVSTDEVLAIYTAMIDPGNDGSGDILNESVTTSVALTGDDHATSSGAFTGSNGNTIEWTAVSEIANGSPFLETTYTFSVTQGSLGVLRFYQYVDLDIAGFPQDVLLVRGSAADGDLELFTVDDGESWGIGAGASYDAGQGLAGATFAGWAADVVPDIIVPILDAAGPPAVSPDGEIDTGDMPPMTQRFFGAGYGPTDVTFAFAWDLDPSATTATIVTRLGGFPDPVKAAPEIPTLSGEGIAVFASTLIAIALGMLAVRRRRAT
jgi:hypothetical protein